MFVGILWREEGWMRMIGIRMGFRPFYWMQKVIMG